MAEYAKVVQKQTALTELEEVNKAEEKLMDKYAGSFITNSDREPSAEGK